LYLHLVLIILLLVAAVAEEVLELMEAAVAPELEVIELLVMDLHLLEDLLLAPEKIAVLIQL